MSRLPTVGGDTDNWGTVLNDYLTETAATGTLASSPSAGATTFDIAVVPPGLRVGSYVVIDAYTTECELRAVTGISSNTLTVAALKFAHSSGDTLELITGKELPIELYGITCDGTDEWAPLQRLAYESTSAGMAIRGRYNSATYIGQPLIIHSGSVINEIHIQSRAGYAPVDYGGAMIMLANSVIQIASADPATNRITTTAAHGLSSYDTTNDTRIAFFAPYGETLPTPLVAGKVYYVDTFPSTTELTVSEMPGGSTFDITGTGTGYGGKSIFELSRVYWNRVRVSVTIADVNGVLMSLQQPAFTKDTRVEMQANATNTTVTGVNALDSATINVASTTGLPSSGRVVIEGATTRLFTEISYTGTTATSFTGCSAHPATVGGERVHRNPIGIKLRGQCSYSDNIETGTANYTTAMEISGNGHIVRGFNTVGASAGDTAIRVYGEWHHLEDIWIEQTGRAGVELPGYPGANIRSITIDGSHVIAGNIGVSAFVLDSHGSATHEVTLANFGAGAIIYKNTVTGLELTAWDGVTPGTGEGPANHFLGYYKGHGGNPIVRYLAPKHIEDDWTPNLGTSIVRVRTSTGNKTINLAAAALRLGKDYTIFNGEGANNVIIDPSGAETIGGASTHTLLPGESIRIYSDGATWHILERHSAPSTAYTPTNVTTDRTFDADTVAVAELADVVGTLIADLQTRKILG